MDANKDIDRLYLLTWQQGIFGWQGSYFSTIQGSNWRKICNTSWVKDILSKSSDKDTDEEKGDNTLIDIDYELCDT